MEAIYIISGITALLAIIILIISYVCYRMAFRRKGKSDGNQFFSFEDGTLAPYADIIRESSEALNAHPSERVFITARDGTRLSGVFYPVPGADMTEIQFHGYRSSPEHDFACGGYEAIRKNHNLLLVNQRAHGQSGGKSISFGINERYDVLDWVDYLNRKLGTDVDVMLFGISMGAATVLMASELTLPENVRLAVADCPYSSPEEIIRSVIRSMHLPPSVAFPFVRLGGLVFGGFDICSASPIDAVKRTKLPILLIHGEDDGFVPCEMSRRIYENISSEKRKIVTFPAADHGTSFLVDRERYLGEVKSFTEESKRR